MAKIVAFTLGSLGLLDLAILGLAALSALPLLTQDPALYQRLLEFCLRTTLIFNLPLAVTIYALLKFSAHKTTPNPTK